MYIEGVAGVKAGAWMAVVVVVCVCVIMIGSSGCAWCSEEAAAFQKKAGLEKDARYREEDITMDGGRFGQGRGAVQGPELCSDEARQPPAGTRSHSRWVCVL